MFVDWHCKVFVAQSISMIFTLAIFKHKLNQNSYFLREILRNKIMMTFYRIKGIGTQHIQQFLPFNVNTVMGMVVKSFFLNFVDIQ